MSKFQRGDVVEWVGAFDHEYFSTLSLIVLGDGPKPNTFYAKISTEVEDDKRDFYSDGLWKLVSPAKDEPYHSEVTIDDFVDTDSNHNREIRVTSSTGGSKGKKVAQMSLVPVDALWELLEQYGNGAAKYPSEDGLDNWRHGYEWSLSFDAAFRHLLQALNGEDIDEELNVKHVIATAWHCLTIAHFMNRDDLAEYDDRQAVVLKKYLENKDG